MDIEYYDFREHLESIEWIQSLPKGYVSQQIDLRYHAVSIKKTSEGLEIYIGPKKPENGGDAIQIRLDRKFQLIDHLIERLEPIPLGSR